MICPTALALVRVIPFIGRIIQDAPRKALLIPDNRNAHKARAVRAWSQAHADRIEVFYLPPYSPELNLTEHFNGYLKGEILCGIRP